MSGTFIQDAVQYLQRFVRHPFEEIAHLPVWSLRQLLLVHAALALISGTISGFVPPSFWRILQGLLFFPILVSVLGAILAAFFYYYFQLFERRTVPFQRLLTLVYFANWPFFLFHIPSNYFPPADLFGLAMSAALLIIGLTENFQLEKRRSLRLVGALFGLLFLLWLAEKASNYSRSREPDSVSRVREPDSAVKAS